MWDEFVVGCLLLRLLLFVVVVVVVLRGYFSGFSNFPSSPKKTPNSNSTRMEDLYENWQLG